MNDRQAWLAERRSGIGGSEAPALYGVHPWMSPFSLYESKTSEVLDDRDTPPMRWGRRLEPVVRQAYMEEVGRTVFDGVANMRHKELDFVIANTDGTIVPVPEHDGCGVYEGKTTSVFNERDWEEGVPLYYQVQVQHYLAVTGLAWGSICVLIMGSRDPLRWMDLERNDAFIADLLEREERFWRDHVLAGIPPEPDEHPATARALKLLHPRDTGGVVDLPPEAADWAAELADIRQAAKMLDSQKTALQNKLKLAIGDASYGRFEDGKGFSFKVVERPEHVVKASSYRVLRKASSKAIAAAMAAMKEAQ